jgi:hypothetical protein
MPTSDQPGTTTAQTAGVLEDGTGTGLTPGLESENLNMHRHVLILRMATRSQREESPINDTDPRPDDTTADPDSSPDSSPVPADLYSDLTLCACGAQTVPGRLCRKCSSRATWSRRKDGATRERNRTADRPPNRSESRTGTGPKPRRRDR